MNEILGLLVLVAAGMLLLALVSYTPSDPSLNTVGSVAAGSRPAHNWTGLAGAYLADAMLQVLGLSAYFLPVLLIRLGVFWLRSRPAGSPLAKFLGLGVVADLCPGGRLRCCPGTCCLRGSLPLSGLSGRMVSDLLVHVLNLPGATIVITLAVALSLYLATTFSFATAREWLTIHFSFVGAMRERWNHWQARRRGTPIPAEMLDEEGEAYGSRREKADAEARRQREELERAAAKANEPASTLLSGIFGWWHRRRHGAEVSIVPHEDTAETPGSMWQAMPRTNVDAPPVTPLTTAMAAAAPYTQALAAAAAPLPLQPDELDEPRTPAQASFIDEEEPFAFLSKPVPAPVAKAAAKQAAATPFAAAPVPAAASANAEPTFGKRADSDLKTVAITAKSVRGYKLPSSSLLYRSEEQNVVREEALREEAKVLVQKCGEFGVDGQVTQINPGPVVTTFEFRPDAGVKYSRVTGLADDLCLAMAAESILIERMAGKSTVGIQVPNHDRETIWLRDVVECESFAQSKSKLAIALGKDINGRIVTADLASMPHVLIAGSTGSGKSVAINAMIMSVLFKSTPEQVRMILVDPKSVELGMYEGIPHLFTPIITEAKLAANALRNAVREMERRLKLLAANHVRNIDQFNKLFDHGSEYLFEDVNQGAAAVHHHHHRRAGRPDDARSIERGGVDYAAGADGARGWYSPDSGDAAAIGRCDHGLDQGQRADAYELPAGDEGGLAHDHR